MFNLFYYYGYLKSLFGFNKINPDNQVLTLQDSPDEEPDFSFDTARDYSASSKTVNLYYSYKNYNNSFAVKGFSKEKTNTMIQNAFNEMSKYSNLKIFPWRKGLPVNFSIQFSSKVTYNALAVTSGSKIIVSNTRPMTEKVVKTVMQHELLHYLKYKANPPADKWGHSTDKKCVYNINGNAPSLCAAEINFLQNKYGK